MIVPAVGPARDLLYQYQYLVYWEHLVKPERPAGFSSGRMSQANTHRAIAQT